MGITGKGLLTVLAMLFLLPILVDMLLMGMMPASVSDVSLTRFLLQGYLRMLPWYILYLLLAFTVLSLIKKYRENTNTKE